MRSGTEKWSGIKNRSGKDRFRLHLSKTVGINDQKRNAKSNHHVAFCNDERITLNAFCNDQRIMVNAVLQHVLRTFKEHL